MNIPFADIKTGHPEQSAYFCAVHYKLILVKSETSHSIGQMPIRRLPAGVSGSVPGQVNDRQALIAHAWNDSVVGPAASISRPIPAQDFRRRKRTADYADRRTT